MDGKSDLSGFLVNGVRKNVKYTLEQIEELPPAAYDFSRYHAIILNHDRIDPPLIQKLLDRSIYSFALPILYLYSDSNSIESENDLIVYLKKPFTPKEFQLSLELLILKFQYEQELQASLGNKHSKELQALADFPKENPNPVMRVSANGRIEYANTASNFLLSQWNKQIGDSLPIKLQSHQKECLQNNKEQTLEINVNEHSFQFNLQPAPGKDYIYVYGKDITLHKQADQQFRQNFQKMDLLYKLIAAANNSENKEEFFTYLIYSIMEVFQCDVGCIHLLDKQKKSAGLVIYEGISQDEIKEFQNISPEQYPFDQVLKEKQVILIDQPYIIPKKSTGAYKRTLYSIILIPLLSKDNILGLLSISSSKHRHQLNEYEKALLFTIGSEAGNAISRFNSETDLKASENRLKAIINHSPIIIYLKDLKGRYLLINDQTQALFSLKQNEILGKTDSDFFEENLVRSLYSEDRALLEHHQSLRTERTFNTVNGMKTFLSTKFLLYNNQKEPYAIGAVMMDITERKRIEEERKRLFNILDLSHNEIYLFDVQSLTYEYVNRGAYKSLGYNNSEMISMTPMDIISDIDEIEFKNTLQSLIKKKKEKIIFETFHKRKDQTCYVVEYNVQLIKLNNEDIFLAMVSDITERKHNEEQLKLAMKVFEHTIEGIVITDDQGTIQSINPAFEEITGYTNKEAIGENPRMLKSDRHAPEFYKKLWDSLITEGKWEGEIWNRRKDGEAYPEWLTINAIYDSQGKVVQYVGVFNDITEIKLKEDQIVYQAYHDPLTGLPNRFLFMDRLELAMAHSQRYHHQLAVMFLDLDRFKIINDSLGHIIGDKLLAKVAKLLINSIREEDTVARMGGDEFTIIIPEIHRPQDVIVTATRIMEKFKKPLIIDSHELFITSSIGISIFPEDGGSAKTLLKNADMAMYQAKQEGRNSYRFFTKELNKKADDILKMEHRIRKAINKNEFFVLYQPQYEMETGKIIGVEALIRWNDPDKGIMSPNDFLPIAEETGFISSMGLQVFQQACKDYKIWMEQGIAPEFLSINLSAKQFSQKDHMAALDKMVKQNGMNPHNIILEITEHSILQYFAGAIKTMQLLKDKGYRLAIDDFGTGYSSLSYLREFPVDIIKIDQSFVQNISTDPRSAALAMAIIIIGHSLDLSIIAEGVETKDQLDFLKQNTCNYFQGFLCSYPSTAKEIIPILKNGYCTF